MKLSDDSPNYICDICGCKFWSNENDVRKVIVDGSRVDMCEPDFNRFAFFTKLFTGATVDDKVMRMIRGRDE